MANVLFKRGLQSALPTSEALDGAFYLTTDTHRLYTGLSDGTIVPVNEGVTTVESLDDLPKYETQEEKKLIAGQFYYVSNNNILCVFNGTDWVQINPDTDSNDDTVTTSLDLDKVVNVETGTITISITLQEVKKDKSGAEIEGTAKPFTDSIVISAEDIGTIVTETKVGLKATVGEKQATINTEGVGADNSNGYIVKAGDNVNIEKNADDSDGYTIKAVDTTYELQSSANSTDIELKEADGVVVDTISIIGSTTDVIVDGTNVDEIDIKHKSYDGTKGIGTNTVTGTDTKTFTAITDLSLSNGHVASYKTSDFSFTDSDTTYYINDISADATGKIIISMKDDSGAEVGGVSDQDLYYIINNTKYYNQADLSSVLDDLHEDLRQEINALHYKGTVASYSALPIDSAEIGDIYMLSADDNTYKAGDLFIAQGIEDEDGYINAITWVHVPSGNEIDTTYEHYFGSKSDNAIPLVLDSSTGVDDPVNFVEGTYIELSGDEDNLTISHNTTSRENTISTDTVKLDGTDSSFTVIDTIETNTTGHITKVNTKTVTIDKETTYNLSVDDTNTTDIVLKDDVGKKSIVSMKAGTDLEVSGDSEADTITYNHKTIKTTLLETSATIEHSGDFTVIDNIAVSDTGHVTQINTKTVTLPNGYALDGELTTTVNEDGISTYTKTVVLEDAKSGAVIDTAQNVSFTSSTLQFEKDATDTTLSKIDIVWGTF